MLTTSPCRRWGGSFPNCVYDLSHPACKSSSRDAPSYTVAYVEHVYCIPVTIIVDVTCHFLCACYCYFQGSVNVDDMTPYCALPNFLEDLTPVALNKRLVVIDEIGKGSFSRVYKACFDNKIVALKVLEPSQACKEQGVQLRLFFREAEFMSKCDCR
jgi:hypothetical protein